MSQELTNLQNLCVGVTAAFIESIILQPTIYWKNAKAQRLPFSINPRVVYRGTSASIFNECQMMGLQFGITSFFQNMLNYNNTNNNSSTSSYISDNRIDSLLSSALGGGITSIFTSPIELIMIQQQLKGTSFIETPIKIIKYHGFFYKGLYRGLSMTIARDSIYVMGMLGVTPFVQDQLQKRYNMSLITSSFYASIIGGIFGALPSHPFDIIKTCMQGDLHQGLYKNVLQTIYTLWKQGGIQRIYSGCIWRTINIVGTVYIANECKIRLPILLHMKSHS